VNKKIQCFAREEEAKKKIKKKEKRNPEAKVSADPGQFPFTGVLFCVIPIRRIGFGFGFGL